MSLQTLDITQVPPASRSTVVDTVIPVSVNGQVDFNIFTMPTGNHILIINGVEYLNNQNYIITTPGGNVQVHWFSEFTITTSDYIIFRKY